MNFDELKKLGVDVDEAVERFLGNTNLYKKMLGKLLELIEQANVQPDFNGDDYADVIERAHALKGATGNLSITPLYDGYTQIVELLRKEKPEEARKILMEILPLQDEIIDCIKKSIYG